MRGEGWGDLGEGFIREGVEEKGRVKRVWGGGDANFMQEYPSNTGDLRNLFLKNKS